MKFSGKMCLKIILEVTKKQGFSLSLENMLFEKPQGGAGQIDKRCLASFRARIIVRYLHHLESPTRSELDLNLRRTRFQALLNEVVQ